MFFLQCSEVLNLLHIGINLRVQGGFNYCTGAFNILLLTKSGRFGHGAQGLLPCYSNFFKQCLAFGRIDQGHNLLLHFSDGSGAHFLVHQLGHGLVGGAHLHHQAGGIQGHHAMPLCGQGGAFLD